MKEQSKILLVKLGSIGDVVNTLPLANVLKNAFPETTLAWLIEPKSFPIVEGHRTVDRFIVFERGKGWAGARRALKEIREFSPGLVIDLQRILRSSFFTLLSRSPRRLGFDRKRCKEASWLFTDEKIPPADPSRHMVEQYLEFASYLGARPAPPVFDLPIGEAERNNARALLPSEARERGFIVLNIGATKPANRWPERNAAAFCRLVAEKTPCLTVLTGGGEDRSRAETIVSLSASSGRVVSLAGSTTLKQLGGLFLSARAVVSNDSGPMHIASALGVPTIGLFGPADPRRTGPFRHLSLVVRSPADCSPCGRRSCPRAVCLAEIRPETVLDRLLPYL
ncbi:MAG: glycosyltransferase family 9 protein [Candidatus Aureabacteria bacterium]|nr:glycosyltransferase family 9 protein [Candidatus Auribacterota bacterium]